MARRISSGIPALGAALALGFAGCLSDDQPSSGDQENPWIQAAGPIQTGSVYAMAALGGTVFAGTDQGVFRSADSGLSWTAANAGLTVPNVRALAVLGQALFAGTGGAGVIGGGVFRSTDGGTSWTLVDSGLTSANVSAFAVSGADLFAATGGGIFRSSDGGNTWIAVNNGLPTQMGVVLGLSHLVAHGANLVAVGAGVFRSTDNGASWIPVNADLTASHAIRTIAVSGPDLFAGASREPSVGGGLAGGAFRSMDGGAHWSAVNNGLAEPPSVNVLAVSGADIFAGTDHGVFRSTNKGATWTAFNAGMPAGAGIVPSVTAFAVHGSSLYAGTSGTDNGARVWRRPLPH
jgi:hypothetical protein